MKKSVFLIGATGFLGSSIASTLAGKVYLGSRKNGDYDCNLFDRRGLKKAIDDADPEVIVNAAGSVKESMDKMWETNVKGTVNLLEASGGRRVIAISSADVYGNAKAKLSEKSLPEPLSQYGFTKSVADALCRNYIDERNYPITILRPFMVYGPGQPKKMLISQAVDSALRGAVINLRTARAIRDPLYVDDFATAVAAAIGSKKTAGKEINLGSGKGVSVEQMAKKIIDIIGSSSEINVESGYVDYSVPRELVADITEATRLISFNPKTSFDEGLRQTVNWYRKLL